MENYKNFIREDLSSVRNTILSIEPKPNLTKLNDNKNPHNPSFDKDINKYPDDTALKASLAHLYNTKEENILPTIGSSQGIELLIKAFCKPNIDRILICPPTYEMYEFYATIHSIKTEKVPLSIPNFQLRVTDIWSKCKLHNVKLVFITSPNSPMGHLMNKSDIEYLLKITEKSALIVIDEAYVEFSKSKSIAQLLNEFKNLVILRTLSKEFAASGLRVGSVLSHKEIINELEMLQTPYAKVPSPVSEIAINKLLTPEGIKFAQSNVQKIIQEKQRVITLLAQIPFIDKIYHSQTNFILISTHKNDSAIEFCKKNGILLKKIHSEIVEGIRVSIGSEKENNHLIKLLNDFKG